MGNVYLICGKICAGKSTYAKKLAEEKSAVILSADEVTTLFARDLGDRHDEIALRVRQYLMEKAAQIARCGCSVILDWGFWTGEMRRDADAFFRSRGIDPIWHYLDISDALWAERIARRNLHPGQADYVVDDGLRQKCLQLFEPPQRDEIDVWHTVG